MGLVGEIKQPRLVMWDRFLEWGFKREADRQWEEAQRTIDDIADIGEPKKKVIDIMAEDTDPNEVTIENAYKTRWIWYHTILAIGIFFTNIVLIAILLLLAIKL